ncbi:MAG: class I SAM-dependent methyltransferase, partial [bacterium]|nr:class I SAM-dependent methyltransferase [bacterium]
MSELFDGNAIAEVRSMENRDAPSKAILFNSIASLYGMFYNYQKRRFSSLLNILQSKILLDRYQTIIDVGCGTGALCSVLSQRGFVVTGVDNSLKMLRVGAQKKENIAVQFVQASALEKLPFADKSFDVAIAAHVIHGLK